MSFRSYPEEDAELRNYPTFARGSEGNEALKHSSMISSSLRPDLA
jgi:hypothetical protein